MGCLSNHGFLHFRQPAPLFRKEIISHGAAVCIAGKCEFCFFIARHYDDFLELGLLGLFLQSFIVQVTMSALAIIIFVIVYGRMIEIYLMVSLAPIPLSTFGNREQSNIGQNYLRSLFAIGFQGFLIMICVGIYAVLIQSIAFSDDIIGSIWGVMGYTVLLCFTLFKTGSLAKGVFSAH